MHLKFWLIFLPVAVVVIALSVVNRDLVAFNIGFGAGWQMPLFLLLLASGLLGILIGGTAAWLAGGRARKRARRARAETAQVQDELTVAQRKMAAMQTELDQLRGPNAIAEDAAAPAALTRIESNAA